MESYTVYELIGNVTKILGLVVFLAVPPILRAIRPFMSKWGVYGITLLVMILLYSAGDLFARQALVRGWQPAAQHYGH